MHFRQYRVKFNKQNQQIVPINKRMVTRADRRCKISWLFGQPGGVRLFGHRVSQILAKHPEQLEDISHREGTTQTSNIGNKLFSLQPRSRIHNRPLEGAH